MLAIPIELEWVAPAECPTAAAVLDSVARLAEPAPGAAPLRARAVVERAGADRWRVKIETLGNDAGERSLEAPTCRELADATAIVLALGARAAATPEAAPPPAPPQAPAAPPPVLASPPSPPRFTARTPEAPAAPSDSPHGWLLGLVAASGIGEMPSPDVEGALTLGWSGDHWRAELFGAAGAIQHTRVSGYGAVGADAHLAAFGARACTLVLPSAVSVSLCGEGEGDWLWLEGHGASPSLNTNAGWAAFGAGALVTWQLPGPFALRASLEGLVPVIRPHFVLEDASGNVAAVVHQPSAALGRGSLGIEAHFF